MLSGPILAPLAGGAARQIVILLHGYGSSGDDMIALAPPWQMRLPHAVFVAPNAHQPCLDVPGGYQWWKLTSFAPDELSAGAAAAAPILDAFVDQQLAQHRLSEDRLLLIGFSQGTMMSLRIGPARTRQVAGIVGFSGMLVDTAVLLGDGATKPPVLLVHGAADPMIPVEAMHATSEILQNLSYQVGTFAAPGVGHSIDPAGLSLAADFAVQVLGG